jgi:hypothetical protein
MLLWIPRTPEGGAMLGGFWRQAWLNAKSRALAKEDFSQYDEPTAEDHELHVVGKVCAYCGKVISAAQPARRVGDDDWAHEDCHRPRNGEVGGERDNRTGAGQEKSS